MGIDLTPQLSGISWFSATMSSNSCALNLVKPYVFEMWIFWWAGSLNLALLRASVTCSLFCSLLRMDMMTWLMWTLATDDLEVLIRECLSFLTHFVGLFLTTLLHITSKLISNFNNSLILLLFLSHISWVSSVRIYYACWLQVMYLLWVKLQEELNDLQTSGGSCLHWMSRVVKCWNMRYERVLVVR